MTNENVQRALTFFGVQARSIKKPTDAKLASVYIVDDRYVLRSRSRADNIETRFAAERDLLDFVTGLTGYRFPNYLPSNQGEHFFVDGQYLWTLHELIPGKTLGNRYELHVIPSHVDKQVMAALRRLQDATMGRFTEMLISRTFFPELLQPVLAEAPAFLTEYSLRRIESCFRFL